MKRMQVVCDYGDVDFDQVSKRPFTPVPGGVPHTIDGG
jgi:5,10-methylene-tetrahydrofolate dehydrogenase/methenyl tetrahydrofolate cyclohydrolase